MSIYVKGKFLEKLYRIAGQQGKTATKILSEIVEKELEQLD